MRTREPDGYEFGQNFKPIMDMNFLMGIKNFHGHGFEMAKPDGSVPVASLLLPSYPRDNV